jgi:hypothetical protein
LEVRYIMYAAGRRLKSANAKIRTWHFRRYRKSPWPLPLIIIYDLIY